MTAEILTQIAMATALNLASVTCVTPFLRPFQNAGYVPGSSKDMTVGYGITGANRSRHEDYLMLGTKGTTKTKDGSIVLASMDKESDNSQRGQDPGRARLRADPVYSETAVEQGAQGVSRAPEKGIRGSRSVNVQHR